MPRKTDRDFTGLFSAAGILDAIAGPQVSDSIQMVYQIGDLSELGPIFQPVRGFLTTTVGNVAARVSGVEIRPTTNAPVIVEWLRNDATIPMIYNVSQSGITNDIVAITPDFETGGATRAALVQGTRAVNATGIQLPVGENLADRHPDIIVDPGTIFTILGVTVNTTVTVSLAWREIPRAAVAS